MDISKLMLTLIKDGISDHLNNFFYSCADEICGYLTLNYHQFVNIGWTEDEYNYMYRVIHSIFTNPTVLYLDETKLPQDLFDFPHSIQKQILNCLKDKQHCLINALVNKYSEKDTKTLIDFDWRLKMIMGSSKVSSLREPLLQLDLRVVENDNESILDIEMDKNELDNFIKTLESAIL